MLSQRAADEAALARAAALDAIELQRRAWHVSIEKLAVRSTMASSTYRRLCAAPAAVTIKQIETLTHAMAKLRATTKLEADQAERMIEGNYNAFLASACRLTGLDIKAVRGADPSAGRRAGEGGTAIARARMLAIYLCNTVIGIAQRPLSRVVGVTPPAISLSVRAIQDLRDDDPAFAELLEAVAHDVAGRSE